MGVKERYDERKKKNQNTSGNKTATLGVAERFERKKYYNTLDTDSVDDKYVTPLYPTPTVFLSGVGDNSISYGDATTRLSDLNTRYDTIQGWLYKNKSQLDEETYKGLSSSFDELRGGLDSIRDYYGQFGSEEEYNEWYNRESFIKNYLSDPEKAVQGEYDDSWLKEAQYRAEVQNVLGAEDFETNVSAGEALGVDSAKWWEFWEKPENTVAQMRNDPDLLASYEQSARESDGALGAGVAKNTFLDQITYKAAKYMTDDEYKVYNYYVGKGETEKAEAFLSSIEDTLNRRQAGQMVSDVQGNRLKELAFAFEAGTNQFITGLRGLDNWIMGTDPDLTPAVQYANAEIGGSLDGGWKVAYDLTSTTANMLPSILISTIPAVGTVAGTASMGLSATGNAYNEMRNLGYDEGAAQNYALLVGASEAVLQYALGGISKLGGKVSGNIISKVVNKIDNALAKVAIQLGGNMLSEGLEEATQSVLEPIFKALTTGEDFEGIDIEEVVYSGLLGMLSAGVLEGGSTVVGNAITGSEAKQYYGNGADLVTEALEIDPNNTYAQKLQAKLDKGKNLSGLEINQLVEQNESAMVTNDTTAIRDAAMQRLTELGEEGDVEAIATALAKQASGERLSVSERYLIRNSLNGQRVANELNTQNIQSGEYSSSWAEKIGTNRINAEEYGRMLTELEADTETAEAPAAIARESQTVATPAEVNEGFTGEAEAVDVTESAPAAEVAAEGEFEAVETTAVAESEPTITLEEASKKYGAQAGAMVHTYTQGQDVAQYDQAYKAAYDMGMSGVSLSYAMNSEATSYLSESQRELAYEVGRAASDTSAQEQDERNKAKATGKTGRRRGTVKGEGVTVADLKESFNDTQGTAYKLLSTYAEATGIDIVLYKSEANADGNFEGAQGKFKWSEDAIYIDVNAGLANIKSMDDVAKYTMLRTFAHEFTHFMEKWNPVQYNEFRRVVFDTMTERGENVHDLIEQKQAQSGDTMTYDQASREVMAEAMTDILPDANFVEQLAENHKTIFDKLLEKLKEFVADLKAYFKTIGTNPSREARALKEQVGESVKYVESIVALFDRVAVEAVESYQRTVATEEAVVEEKTDVQTPSDTPTTQNHATIEEKPSDFETAFWNASQAERDEVVEAINENTKLSHMMPTEIRGEKPTSTVEEVKTNVEDVDNRGAVSQSDADRAGDSPVLEGLQAQDVPRDGAGGDSVGDPVQRGQEAGRSGLQSDNSTGDVGGHGDGSRESADLRRDDGLSSDDAPIYDIHATFDSLIDKVSDENVAAGIAKAKAEYHVNDEEIFAIDSYVKGRAYDLSRLQRSGDGAEWSELDRYLADNILSGLNKHPTFAGRTYRNLQFGSVFDSETAYEDFINEHAEGKEVTLNAFTSASKNPNGYPLVGDKIVHLVIDGVSARDISETMGQGQAEVIYLPGTKYKVNKVTTANDGHPLIYGEEIVTHEVQELSGGTESAGLHRGDEAVSEGQEHDVRGMGGLGGEPESGGRSGEMAVHEPRSVSSPETEGLHREVEQEIARKSTEKPRGRNFVIGDSLDLPNGEKARYKANVEAIRLVKQLEVEGRYATEDEQVILSKYVGWGGLANAFDARKADWAKEYAELSEILTKEEYESARGSTLNAHYTDISVIKAMYDGLSRLGFDGGRMLEPSSGVGNFVGAMPTAMSEKVKSWTMVELDGITGLIAKYLYPNADVRIQGFEKANIPDNFMDVVISNVPFGNYAIADKAYPKRVTSAIHNYFFAKSLDKVRPGGIVMFITSSYTMNAKDNAVRRYIMGKADLLGAIRLPDSAFKGNAGTEVVTDILVLKKREANTPYTGVDFLEAPWTRLQNESYNGAYINSYFTEHPEMVLGTATMNGSMYRGDSLTYKAFTDRGSLADQIREAFSHIEGKMDYPAQASRERTNFAVERAGKQTKERGLVVKDGKVYQNQNGELVEKQVAKGAIDRITGMLEIRDAARDLMNYQQQGLNESEIKKARTKLNKAYDAFVKKHGFINSQANKNAILDDPDRYSILALENWNPDTKKATKADIFSKNTISPNRTVTSAKDVGEGLIVSVNQTGGVDTALIARLTGKTEADVERELIDGRIAFKNRNGTLEAAEVYLSGNVRAKLRDAEALAPMDADYRNNVEALRAVMPEDVGYQDIFVNPGTPWIPNSVYSDFAAYMLGGRNTEWRKDVDITRNADTGNFTIELTGRYLKTNAANTQKWGTPRRSFLDLFDAMLNSKSVVVKDKLDDGSFVVNKDATAAANEKIENIQKEFQEWLWQDEARRAELTTLYNETFNSIVTPKYNGDNLTVNGANALKPLRPHQRNAVQRVISSGGNTLLAHKVGAGKTYEMAAAAMKLKELGLVKKPMFAVPKSLVAQWGVEFKDFFPTAKLLVAEASDFTAANRKVFMNRIANGEYDAVIVSYEQFEKLPMSDDFTRDLYQEQIDSIVAAIEEAKAEKGDKALSIKDLEKKRKSLQTKIDKLTDKAKDEDNIDFEGLGVDSLFVDEAHNFKNLFYTTSMTNVSGLGNKDGSKRAFDLYTKVRYLQQLNGGRGIVFATATPVMNSMSEMYIMQKYLQPDLLNQLGLSTFDAWAKQFGEVVNGVEIKPSGQGYRVKQSFSRFKNMSELQLLFRNFADVLTDIPGLKIPKMKGGKVNVVVCEPGQFQQDYMKELEKRADNIKNVDPSVDNMLKITSDGRKISYTQRMIDPTLPYEEGSKIFRCADNVIAGYNASKDIKGTQLVFLDMATPKGKSKAETTTEDADLDMDMESAQLYDDLKARLISGGIPAKEIAFIHDADTDQKKKKLFADVNDGKVRVLIGSTGKMGVGMNAQKRVVAIHHLDAPWRPGDVEQRNGRAFRQGNINDVVECFTYVTEGSFDARLWDILERKQNFINQVMNGESVGRETEDTGEVTLSAAEVKALASGSPLIMEQVQLDTDIKKLESLYRSHVSAVRAAKEKLSRDKGSIATLESFIEDGKADIAARKDTYSEGNFSITVGKMKYTDKKEAGVALMAQATAKANEQEYTTVATFAGFELQVIKTHEGIKGMVQGVQGYPFNTYPNNTTFMINHLISTVEGIDSKVKMWENSLIETRADMAEQEKFIQEPFAKQAELDQKRARYNEVMEILNPKEEQSLDGVAEETVQEQSRAYLEAKDSEGNVLTEEQAEFFKESKARDANGNLLVLYHGTANAGFTVFEPSKGKFGGNWFTTSRKDADSYGGNYSHKLFDPSETDDIRTATGGNYTLGSWMRFDTAEDRANFLNEHPNAETLKTDDEYDRMLNEAQAARDWDEYDRIEEEQNNHRKQMSELQRAYARYEWEHSRVATLGELFAYPERFSVSDVLRAWDAYDSNNAAGDEDYTKDELIDGLRAENNRLIEDGDDSIEDLTFKARIPVGETGEIVNFANNRTYAVYTNVTNPYIIDARQKTLAGANLYPTIEAGMNAEEYDGVIVRNARVGAHQEIGDVVIIKKSEQVKLTSNKKVSADTDIRYQQRTNTLTDREVLSMAAERLEGSPDLTEGERDALRIFKNRLNELQILQEERQELGALYKKQQFAKPADREAAAQTLNRMHILDDKIKAAGAAILTVEDKKVLGGVLKKARKVVEEQERAHGKEILDRWRDRTKNAAAIKKYRERIQADVAELSGWILKPNNKDIVKHVPDALKNTVIPFLTSIDFTSKQQLRGGEATKADAEFMNRLNQLNGAIKENMDVNGLYSGYNDLPPNFMDNLQIFINSMQAIVNQHSGEFIVNRMTADELHELSKVVRTLKQYITQINRFHANAMFQHVYEAGDNTIESLSVMGSNNGKANGVSNFVFWQQMRPAYAFERFGEGGKAIYDGLRRGQAQLAFNTQKIVEFSKKAYTEQEVKAWEKEIKEIVLGGHIVKMKVSHMMSFYELSKQADSLRHMLKGGIRVATYTKGGKKISDNGHIVTEADVQTIIGALTERQREVADNLQKYMAQQGGAWGNHVSVARFGEELFTNEQYFPINSDGRHLQSNADENPSAASLYALLNMSFTKSRNEKANNRIILYSIFDVFSNHMASMAQYNAMALPVLDALKWFNYQQKAENPDGERYIVGSVREQMTRVYGVPEESRPGSGRQGYAESFVLNILKAFNGTEAQGAPTDAMGMTALRRYNMAQVAYNLRVVVQQPLAVTRAALLIDYGSIMKGLARNTTAIRKNITEMREHSGIAAWKALGFYDVNISRGLTDLIKHKSTIGDKISDVGMWGAEKADIITWAGIWSAAKEEVIKKQGLKPGQDGFYEAVTTLFEDIIYKTQVVDSILTKNEYMRSKGFFARAIGSFMSEPTTTASMVLNAYDKYHMDMQSGMSRQQAWKKNGKLIGRTIYVYGVTQVLLAAVTAVMDAWRDDDDYETFLEKWLEQFGGNLADELLPFNKLPILSDFYDLAKELLSIFGVDTYGNPPQSIFMQWYDSLIKGAEIMYDRITGEDTNYTWYGGIYKLLQAVSGMAGLPMAAATREIVTIWNNTVGSMAPSLKVKTYDSGDMNEIKYAYADGYLTAEEAAAKLLEKGLVDNEDEAYFTIQGWEVGEGYSRYDAIYDAVLNGGDFDAAMEELVSHGYDEEDVIKQVKSQIGRWYSDEESAVRISKQQAITMLDKYTDMDDAEITKTVNKWSSKVVTGIAYDDIDDEFMAGNISASRAIEMYKRYGSMTQEDAEKKVTVLAFVKEHPECEGISYAAVEGYRLYSEPLGVDASLFYDIWQYNSDTKADVDEDGKAISGSKKAKVLDYINSLDLSGKQKDSLYYAFGWAESTISDAPWR